MILFTCETAQAQFLKKTPNSKNIIATLHIVTIEKSELTLLHYISMVFYTITVIVEIPNLIPGKVFP